MNHVFFVDMPGHCPWHVGGTQQKHEKFELVERVPKGSVARMWATDARLTLEQRHLWEGIPRSQGPNETVRLV